MRKLRCKVYQVNNFPMKKHSHVLLPVLAPEPEKVNPLGLAGGKEEVLFQKELSEGSLVCVEGKNYTLIKKETRWFICFSGLRKGMRCVLEVGSPSSHCN